MTKILLKILLLIFPFVCLGQKKIIHFFDEADKKPISGLELFSETGSFIGSTNDVGEYELNLQLLQQGGINSVLAYNSDYFSLEYNLNNMPSTIYLKKNQAIQLSEIIIKPKGADDKFILSGYFRSWQLVNGKLAKYGDGIVNYSVPFAAVKNDFNTGIKAKFLSFRTFKIDSLKQKSRIINISSFDDYLNVSHIPKNDLLQRERYYKTGSLENGRCEIYENDKKVGNAIFDDKKYLSEINISRKFEDDEAIKILFWKITGSYQEIERWKGQGNTRHPIYLFTSKKTVKNIKGKDFNLETITEIFIENEITEDEKKSQALKTILDKDRSFYHSNYWDEQFLKHPLPSEIKLQLVNVNENKNTFK